jgi:hypothetical protein
MQHVVIGRSLALLIGASILLCGPGHEVAAAAGIEVEFEPPRLIVRGEALTLEVAVLDEQGAVGVAHVRPGSSGPFTGLTLAAGPAGGLVAKVPARLLRGTVVEEYVVVHVAATDQSVTIPPAGATAPFRTVILDDPSRITLAQHTFDDLRSPDAIVAQADPGSGPGEAGFACPAEGTCAEPTSFDVEADGTVWVADSANHRLLVWEPDHPSRPSRAIALEYTPLELAIAPDRTVYVRGTKPGVFASRLFALDRDGRQRWWSDLASDMFNAHLRFGSDGVLYSIDLPWGVWTPVTNSDGEPLGITDQVADVRSGQLVADGGFFVDARWALPLGQLAPRDWRAAIVTDGGKLRQAWRISSLNDLDLSMAAVPTVVGGDPLLVFEVYRFSDHTMEHVVVRLSAGGGIRDRFSLGRGGYRGGDVVTDVRVGADGRLYQLQSDPAWGLKIARYDVKGPTSPGVTPSPTPSATPSPSPSVTTPPTVTPPTVTPSSSPSAGVMPPTSPSPNPTTGSARATPVPSSSATVGPANPTPPGQADEMWPAVGLGVAVLACALGAWLYRSRRRRGPPGPPST